MKEPQSRAQRAEWSAVRWLHSALGPDEVCDRTHCEQCGTNDHSEYDNYTGRLEIVS